MIARNPADLVRLPRKQQREMNAFSPTEAKRFLKAAREDPWFAVFSLLLALIPASAPVRRSPSNGATLTWQVGTSACGVP